MHELPDEGELLDLGCGNGAVLCHLLVARPGTPLRGIGVDLAPPTAAWMDTLAPSERARVECRGGISADALPFAAGRFVACASQFGIEYAQLERALPEALRVLRPGAHLGWALHHSGGRPARLAREELGHLDWLEQCGWLPAAAHLMSAVEAEAAQTPARQPGGTVAAARARVAQLLDALKDRVAHSVCPDVLADAATWTNQCFDLARRQGVKAGHAALHQIETLLSDTRARLLDLVSHTLDEAAWRAILARLQAGGVALGPDTGPLEDRGHLMGWWVHGRLGGAPSAGPPDRAQ
ncbi:class I SAM-dependent methyltransferase [Ideonella sp.]|uniref:class I SAM-dependent methyltransferase n=1 Tax=Ideonella sp. TaxID=1929293 RepID=UPI0035AF572F